MHMNLTPLIHEVEQQCRCANPSYTADELVYQLRTTNALIIITHPTALDTALESARQCGIPADHIVTMEKVSSPSQSESYKAIRYPSVPELIDEGLLMPQSFQERRLSPGEGKTKIAFLSFSSGTTGRPKVE